ncbi:MAG: hypothetical protein P4L59_11850 [Desulfosporosinus sp.]|nr:hypothetical protein [Desulfosporosinus sp.]
MLQFIEYNLSLREERTTIKLKPRRILAFLGVIVLAIGGYVGWQIYQGQLLAHQYETDALKLAQVSSSGSTSANLPVPSSNRTKPSASATTEPPGSQPNSNPPSAPSGTSSSGVYKQLISNSYQQTLQTMQNVKSSTLALQGHKMSLSAYRASILQSQAAISSSEDFVRANPPTEENLTSSYQELLAGINLAKQSMDVVLNGISSISPSSLYAARAMGKQAQQQVIEGYGGL